MANGTGSAKAAGVGGDVAGGITGGISSIPGNIATGFVAFLPLGMAAQGNGVGVALLAAAVGGGVFTLLCRTPGLLAGGSMSFALVVAGSLGKLLASGVLPPGLAGLPGALAAVAALTVLTGLCQAGLAASGLGQLVTIMPYPVVAGIRNGVAVLMVLAQLKALLGLTGTGDALNWTHPAAPVVAAATLLLTVRPVRRIPFLPPLPFLTSVPLLPPVLVALAAGTAVQYLLSAVLAPRGGGWLLGPFLDVPAGGAEHLQLLADGWAALLAMPPWQVLAVLVPAAATVAVVSALETLVGASVMQDVSGEHGSSRRDLFALAAANVVSGVGGTLPVTGGTQASMAVWSAGGRGKAAGLVRAGLMLATALLAGPVIGLVPAAALAGMVVGNGTQFFDAELLRLARRALRRGAGGRAEVAGNLLVMAVVVAVAVSVSLVASVLTGAVLSALLFVAAASNRGVRRRYRNPGSLSRTFRPERETELLLRHGAEIEVVELQGALFFGSADRLAREVAGAWAAGARCVVLDVRRVSQVDLSGARRLGQLAARHWRQGAFLFFAGVRPGTTVATSFDVAGLAGTLRADRLFPTLEEALAAAEGVVLAAHPEPAPAAHSPWQGPATEDMLVRVGLPREQMVPFLAHARECAFPPGGTILRAGDGADALFVLLEGTARVSLPAAGAGEEAGQAWLATLTAGTLFGEMALLFGGTRSATVTALTPVRCLTLDRATLDQLRATQPALAHHLMTAIVGQLARNLRMANAALEAAAR